MVPRTSSSSELSLLLHIKPFVAFSFDIQFCLLEWAKAGTSLAIFIFSQHIMQDLMQVGIPELGRENSMLRWTWNVGQSTVDQAM